MAFAEKLVGKFGISSSGRVPASPGVKLEEFEVDEPESIWPFCEVVRGLMWLSN